MKIALIGFMGSGKSTTGKILAEQLKLPFLETDEYALQLSGFSSVAEIFDTLGEARFRLLETKVAHHLTASKDIVISTGGGFILNPEHHVALKANAGKLIYLRTQFKTLQRRIANDSGRPLFRSPQKASELFARRLPLYEQCADIIIDTDMLDPQEVTNQILSSCGEYLP